MSADAIPHPLLSWKGWTPRSKFLTLKCSYHQDRGQEERAQLLLHSARPHALRNAAVHVHAPAQPPLSIHICNPTLKIVLLNRFEERIIKRELFEFLRVNLKCLQEG